MQIWHLGVSSQVVGVEHIHANPGWLAPGKSRGAADLVSCVQQLNGHQWFEKASKLVTILNEANSR
jgi:hypothetical protein